MTHVIIHKDASKIKIETIFFQQSVIFIQQLYDRFAKLKINLSLTELAEVSEGVQKAFAPDAWLKEHLLTKDIIINDVQTITLIRQFISSGYPKSLGMHRLEINLMQLLDNKISPKHNAYDLIERRYTVYANTETGAALAEKLGKLSDSLNDVTDYLTNNQMPIKNLGFEPAGIEFINFRYRPDISFIRDQEAITLSKRANKNTRTILETD